MGWNFPSHLSAIDVRHLSERAFFESIGHAAGPLMQLALVPGGDMQKLHTWASDTPETFVEALTAAANMVLLCRRI